MQFCNPDGLPAYGYSHGNLYTNRNRISQSDCDTIGPGLYPAGMCDNPACHHPT
jgi:hypothetical protein